MNRKNVKTKFNAQDLAYMSLGAVLITICSWISIPTAVPFTLQTMAVFFILAALGGRRGTISIAVYILLGAVGVPVFAHFNSGAGALLGVTGGYIFGFIFMGLIYWFITSFFGEKQSVKIIAMLIGLVVLYIIGTLWFMAVYTKTNGAVGIMTILSMCVFPFVVPDLVKMGLALALAGRLARSIRV